MVVACVSCSIRKMRSVWVSFICMMMFSRATSFVGLPNYLEWTEEHQHCVLRIPPRAVSISSTQVDCRDLPYVSYFRSLMLSPPATLLPRPFLQLNISMKEQDALFDDLHDLASAIFNIYRDAETEKRKILYNFHLSDNDFLQSTNNSNSFPKQDATSKAARYKSAKHDLSVTIYPLLFPVVPNNAVHFQIPPKSQYRMFHNPQFRIQLQETTPEHVLWGEIKDSVFVELDSFSARQVNDKGLLLSLAAGTLPVFTLSTNNNKEVSSFKNQNTDDFSFLFSHLLPPKLVSSLFKYTSFLSNTITVTHNALPTYHQMDRRLYTAIATSLQQFVSNELSTHNLIMYMFHHFVSTHSSTQSRHRNVPHAMFTVNHFPKRLLAVSFSSASKQNKNIDMVLTAFVHGYVSMVRPSVFFTREEYMSNYMNNNEILLVFPAQAVPDLFYSSETDIEAADWSEQVFSQVYRDNPLFTAVFTANEKKLDLVQVLSDKKETWTVFLSVSDTDFNENEKDNDSLYYLLKYICTESSTVTQLLLAISLSKNSHLNNNQFYVHIDRFMNLVCAKRKNKNLNIVLFVA